jgi:predicted transcriptional regulator
MRNNWNITKEEIENKINIKKTAIDDSIAKLKKLGILLK